MVITRRLGYGIGIRIVEKLSNAWLWISNSLESRMLGRGVRANA